MSFTNKMVIVTTESFRMVPSPDLFVVVTRKRTAKTKLSIVDCLKLKFYMFSAERIQRHYHTKMAIYLKRHLPFPSDYFMTSVYCTILFNLSNQEMRFF